MLFRKFIYWLFLTNSLSVLAQTYPRKEIDIDAFIQNLFNQNQQDENVNYEDLYEALYQLYSQPLNLNKANREDLNSLYLLSQEQINKLLDYKKTNGDFLSIYELQAVPGFDLETIYKILPFVEIPDKQQGNIPLWKRILREPNNYFLLRYDRVLQQREGFSQAVPGSNGTIPQRYTGSPDKLYMRYRVSHARDFSFGFTAEKDAGEQIVFNGKTTGFDFLSFHAQIQNRGRLKNLTLGDYQMQFGQGLVLSAGFAVGKGAETITTIRRNNLGIRPYSSVLESGFFRGGAATYALGRFDLTLFYSNTRRDANLLTTSDTTSDEITEPYISSVQISGFHRTPNEISAKNSIGEQIAGSNILYESKDKNLQTGFTMLQTTYSVNLQRQPEVYNQFEFRGRQNLLLGWNYTYNFQNFNFFGEAARSESGGIGLVSGFVSSLSSKIEMSILYRRFDKNFHTFYANAFGENTRNINERGMYWGFKFTPIRKLIFAAYYDKFLFPWLKFQVDAPSEGYEYLLRTTYKPSKTITIYAQYREESKEKNQPDNTTNIDFLARTLRRNYLLDVDFNATPHLFLRSRLQMSSYHIGSGNTTYGYALVQDFNFDFWKFQFSSRFALFDTDDYDNRQYVYEKDVLYAFSIPAYNGRGLRSYFMIQYDLTKKIDIWLRFSQTNLRNAKTIGSGLDEINGNTLSEIKAQIRVKF